MRPHRLLAAPIVAASLAACNDGVCAGVGRPAFEVTVQDAHTGAPLTDSVRILVHRLPDMAVVDSASRQTAPGRYWAADERTGRFTVVVQRPGYLPWTIENQTVTASCSVLTVFLAARLVPR